MNWHALLRRPSVLIAAALLLAVALVWGGLAVSAAQPKSLDQRVYEVSSQIQCPVCNGESVANSPSATAAAMRDAIRTKLTSGESEAQVLQDFQRSYGDGILESPPRSGFTLLIWLGPVVALLAGVLLVGAVAREWRAVPAAATVPGDDDALAADLSEQERRRLRAVLERELADDEGYTPHLGTEGA